MRKIGIFLILAPLVFSSCNKADQTRTSTETPTAPASGASATPATLDREFDVDPVAMTKDFSTWYGYAYYNVRLARDFVGLDTDSRPLQKIDFLNRLTTGKFVYFKTKIQNSVAVYKLFNLTSADKSIRSTIQQMAATELVNLKMEGKELPAYNFIDLKGQRYDNANTKGKVVMLKCWFIGCVACVKEFPDLNRIVDNYDSRTDILFVSLASDSEAKLRSFLPKNEFKYAVVANQEEYMRDRLALQAYPTHILLDRAGKIVKVTTAIDDMLPTLAKLAVEASK